jgi:hypothetical protein
MIRRSLLALGACAAAAAVMASAPGTASAYVRYRTSKNQPYSWREESVSIAGYPHGLPSMTVDQITTAMTASTGAWSREDPANGTCSYLTLALTMMPLDAVPPAAVRDNLNTITLRDGDWTSICSTSTDGRQECHQPGELALTTVWSKVCGEIVEADVEVNADQSVPGAGFKWADLDVTAGAGQRHDLQNALTHEMGHFIGLDHTCVLNGAYPLDKGGNPIVPIDNLGQPVPSCDEVSYTEPDMNQKPTMYPSADPGDLGKRTLSDDDRAGLCAIYPVGTNPVSCGGSSGGCSIAEAGADNDISDHRSSSPRGLAWRWLVVALAGAAGSFVTLRGRRRRLTRR